MEDADKSVGQSTQAFVEEAQLKDAPVVHWQGFQQTRYALCGAHAVVGFAKGMPLPRPNPPRSRWNWLSRSSPCGRSLLDNPGPRLSRRPAPAA
jgi:hypothetical protein